jgi:helix-turn-helix protein
MNEPWLTKAELAKELKISKRTVVRLALPHTKVGGQNRYRLGECEAALRGVPPEGGNVVRLPLDRMRGAAA